MDTQRPRTSVRLLFNLHGLVTAAAGVVLFVAPRAIPAAVGVDVPDDARLVPFMLGAAELAVAALSFGGARLSDRRSLLLLVVVLITFHLATALAEVYAFALGGVSPGIWANVAVRLVVSVLFAFAGLHVARRPARARPRLGPAEPGTPAST
jgi:hypothetical protein